LAAAAELAVLATAKNAARRSITIVYVSYCPPDPGRQQQFSATRVVGDLPDSQCPDSIYSGKNERSFRKIVNVETKKKRGGFACD